MTRITAYSATADLNLPPVAANSISDRDEVSKVLAFHFLYDVPMKGFGNTDRQFSHMDNERVALRLSLHIEEFKELLKKGFGIDVAMQFQVQHPSIDARVETRDIKNALDAATDAGIPRDGKEVMDALGDLRYVDVGMAIEMGYDPRPVVEEIHASNMTKLGDDGKPIINGVSLGYREGEQKFDSTARVGKVLKGPHYVEPNIAAALGWEE